MRPLFKASRFIHLEGRGGPGLGSYFLATLPCTKTEQGGVPFLAVLQIVLYGQGARGYCKADSRLHGGVKI